MRAASLSVVIPVFGSWEHTRRCLCALQSGTYLPTQVLVVNHGPREPTSSKLRDEFSRVKEIPASQDLWWAGATNVGIRQALADGASYVMLLNNDCYVQRDTVATLMEHIARHPTDIVAPLQRDAKSKAIVTAVPKDNMLFGFPTLPGSHRIPPALAGKPLVPTRLINGGRGVIIPRTVFQRIGVLDEDNLPHYGADHDFYFRCRDNGIGLWIATDACVEVDSSQTTLASNLANMTYRDVVHSLRDPKSHRSVAHVVPLFRKHYPVPRLFMIGVFLYYSRYLAVYLLARARKALRYIRRS